MRNEDTLLVHSTYGKGGMMAMVALLFSSSEMGARDDRARGRFGSFAAAVAKGGEGKEGSVRLEVRRGCQMENPGVTVSGLWRE